jgi:carboxypeptidase Taq
METYMPHKGIQQRSEQLALLSKLTHDEFVHATTGTLLQQCQQTPTLTAIQKRNVHLWQKDYDKETKIPSELVTKISQQQALTGHKWRDVRQKKEKAKFTEIQQELETLFELTRDKAVKLNEDRHPYDNLLDIFEPNMTQTMVAEYFDVLKTGIKKVMANLEMVPKEKRPSYDILKIPATEAQQLQLSKYIMGVFGMPTDRTRLDQVEHPFTMGSYDDVRITTRFHEDDPLASFFAVIHESGHALYGLNLPEEHRYTPVGEAIGLGIHESQSRFIENIVGRHPAFLSHIFPKIQEIVPGYKTLSLDNFTKAVNSVRPTKYRVQADEVTYSLHVILRFEIEKLLFNDKITIAELPQVWNEKYEDMFGIPVDNDYEGVLQDTHWYGGMFGYFPDYALGNVYDGQFLRVMEKAIPDWEQQIGEGDTTQVMNWLDTNIHKRGSLYDPAELVEKITGEKPNAQYFIDYLDAKYQKIFQY